jgi:hypothetical protein
MAFEEDTNMQVSSQTIGPAFFIFSRALNNPNGVA